MTEFHFLRPLWLWAFIALAAIVIGLWRSKLGSRHWANVCDPQLLPHLLVGSNTPARPRWAPWLVGLVGSLLILALAGPTWERLPQPVFREQAALVIALDLSRSMNAVDVKPDRLTRARLKITDILKARRSGQTALLVYAGDAFIVSPLTDDVDTIIAQLPSLQTEMMPSQGSRADRALALAQQLLQQAGAKRGQILLITDAVDDSNGALAQAIAALREQGSSVSILGVGTEQGAPIPMADGGFLKDHQGAIVVPKLETANLQRWAQRGGGRFALLRTDDADIQYLLQQASASTLDAAQRAEGLHSDQWREQGPWLIVLAIPFAAWAFRRGLWVMALALLLPLPSPAQAFNWNDLWKRPDQQAAQALQQGAPERAAQLFEDPQWKAAAQYRAGDYQAAASTLEGLNTPNALYNRGNALAKAGDTEAAMASYEAALKLDPKHADARYNLEQLKKQQQSSNAAQNGSQNEQGDAAEQTPETADEQASTQPQDSEQAGAGSSQNEDSNPDQDHEQASNPAQDSSDTQANSPNDSTASSSEADNAAPSQQQTPEQTPSDNTAAQTADDAADATDDAASMAKPADADTEQAQDQTTAAANATQEDLDNPLDDPATQQWLRRIPDDPGGLLRRKFRYQYQQREQHAQSEDKPW